MSNEEGFLVALFAGLFVFALIMFVVGIVLYILMGIGLFKIAKREGKGDVAWMAWVPIVNMFLLTQLVENDVHESMRGKFTLIYGLTLAATFFLSAFIPFIGVVSSILIIYGFYFIIQRYSRNVTLHLVLVILTGMIAMPIQLFMFRNREPIDINDNIVFTE
ncbi:hypothetical protein [Virgibacillus siamensis]|uniref:hypothetical protein n=1 Tax=Virgibacillus siamensis TaxID=480071 RepID=UPI000986519D|nr:hypothetical protein [Virgibacillus siamensis]